MVEGVAADDYETSRALISLLRVHGREHVRRLKDIPRLRKVRSRPP
jgi:hypothetical protein